MDYAEKIRKEREGETKFNFLNPSNPYYPFFLHKIEDFKAGGGIVSFSVCLRWQHLLRPSLNYPVTPHLMQIRFEVFFLAFSSLVVPRN